MKILKQLFPAKVFVTEKGKIVVVWYQSGSYFLKVFDVNGNILVNKFKLSDSIIGAKDKNALNINKNQSLEVKSITGFNEKIKNDDYYVFFSDESKAEFKDDKITGLKLGSVKVDIVSKFNPDNFISQEIVIREAKINDPS